MSHESHEDEPRPGMSGGMMFLTISTPLVLMLVATVVFFAFSKEVTENGTWMPFIVLGTAWVVAALWFVFGGILSLFILLSRRR